jgi:hypothetical protein
VPTSSITLYTLSAMVFSFHSVVTSFLALHYVVPLDSDLHQFASAHVLLA